MLPSTSTKRGFGECPRCKHGYSTRWKPEKCENCGFDLGGTCQSAAKKSKSCCADAVLVQETNNEKIFSTKTSTRDDRCFVVKEGDRFFCTHKDCMNARGIFVASGRVEEFTCKHSDKCVDAVAAQKNFMLSAADVEKYNGDGSSKDMLMSLINSRSAIASDREGGLPFVIKVSDLSYAVIGFPSTNNTLGYSHVKIADGVVTCSSKDTNCKSFVAKGKYERAKKFCVHLHAIFCSGVYTLDPAPSTSVDDNEHGTAMEQATSTQRHSTIKLHSKRSLPYEFITPALLSEIDARNAGVWPSSFFPTVAKCELCAHDLGEAIKHPGGGGQAYLITSGGTPFSKVEVRVKICGDTNCRAIHQVFTTDIGLFNIADSILISFDILLEWREHFKLGHPISNVISAKLSFLNQKLEKPCRLSDAKLEYIGKLLYHGFYCFEAITTRSLDDVICEYLFVRCPRSKKY